MNQYGITCDQLRIMHRNNVHEKKKRMKQVNKNLLYGESWWDIGFEGNGGVKSKETRFCNSKGKCHSPIFSPFVAYTMFVC